MIGMMNGIGARTPFIMPIMLILSKQLFRITATRILSRT